MDENEKIIKQKETKVIQCDRCGGTFYKLDNLRRHFHKKKVCKPVLKDIPIEQLIEKYKVNKGCYKCENCGKEYKSANGKSFFAPKPYDVLKKIKAHNTLTVGWNPYQRTTVATKFELRNLDQLLGWAKEDGCKLDI